jgi:hypothetical protein
MAANPPQVNPAILTVPPAFIVYDGMVLCGVNDDAEFKGDTPAVRIASDLFGDDFATCMNKGFTELDYEFKTCCELTVNQGQVRLLPGTKRNIKAFIQWVRDERRLGRDPFTMAFPAENVLPTLYNGGGKETPHVVGRIRKTNHVSIHYV